MWLQPQQIPQVLVQVRSAAFRDVISHKLHGSRHVRQYSRFVISLACLFWKRIDEIDLQLVEVLVYPREVPVSAIRELALNDEVELLVCKDVTRHRSSHRCEKILLLLLLVAIAARASLVTVAILLRLPTQAHSVHAVL